MARTEQELSRKVLDLEKYAHLDSMEGVVLTEPKLPNLYSVDGIKRVFPGTLVAVVVALAASFLASHYATPVMFLALLIGLAFDFLSREAITQPGIEFSSRTVLRFGVALLGARITFAQIFDLGLGNVLAVIGAVLFTILCGSALAKLMGLSREQGLLSGGAVAICGASAALAIASVMPRSKDLERNTIFTVVSVTTLSTVAMIVYPIFTQIIGFSDHQAGVFLGGTIHDVAQVIGAGFSVSQEAGDTSTIVKLLRVTMLLPVVLMFTFLFRKEKSEGGERPVTIPMFLVAFGALVAINSLGIVPEVVMSGLGDVSRWCLITAIAALGMKTSFKALSLVGWRPVLLVVAETLLMAGFVLGYLLLV
jgi:uncharacterized integral membrane protein (TIGR00698 family)